MRNKGFTKRIRRCIIVAGFLLLAGAVKQPAMTSYAADYTTQQQVAQITTYSKDQAATLGQWELQADGVHYKFKAFSGEYITSSWIPSQTETGVWYFVGADGIMLTSTTTPDNYTVDAQGKWYDSTYTSGSSSSSHSSSSSSNSSSSQSQQATETETEAAETSNSSSSNSSTESSSTSSSSNGNKSSGLPSNLINSRGRSNTGEIIAGYSR
ncbi:MAG: hypothetical protein LUC99_03130 [Clostridiales bacterium]|nr:hypothetical protein [Clostridiales bacterium]